MKKYTPILLLFSILVCTYTATHTRPIDRVYGLTAMALSYSLDTMRMRQVLESTAFEDPFARYIASRKLYRFGLTCIPLIGTHLRCTNKQCEGICNDCKLKFIYAELPIQLMAFHEHSNLINGFEIFLLGCALCAQTTTKIFDTSHLTDQDEQTIDED